MTKTEAIDKILKMTEKQKERLKLVKKIRDDLRNGDLTKKIGAQDIAPWIPGNSVGTAQRYLDILEASEQEEPAKQQSAASAEPLVLPSDVTKILDEMTTAIPRLGESVLKSIQTATQEENARGQLVWNGQKIAFEITVADITEQLSSRNRALEDSTAECEVKTDRIGELEALQSATASARDAFAASLNAAKAEIETLKSDRELIQAKLGYVEQNVAVLKTVLSDANRDIEKYRKDSHTIFEMKVQCSRAEEQRAAIAREAETLRSTIDTMTKTHEQTFSRAREEIAAAKMRNSELENKLMAAFHPHFDAATARTSPAE
jgi:chromosome segregation ATPase